MELKAGGVIVIYWMSMFAVQLTQILSKNNQKSSSNDDLVVTSSRPRAFLYFAMALRHVETGAKLKWLPCCATKKCVEVFDDNMIWEG